MDHESVLTAVTAWARAQDDVRVVLLTGSGARGTLDRWSDLDVEVWTRRPQVLLDDDGWFRGWGEVLVVERPRDRSWLPTRLVAYAGGKLDLAVGDVAAIGGRVAPQPFRVLVDKDRVTGSLPTGTDRACGPPAAADVTYSIEVFWSAALMWAKLTARGEVWNALTVRAADARRHLLRVAEWEHRSRHGWDADVRYDGRGLETWADPAVTAALHATFGTADPEGSAAALRAACAAFSRLCPVVEAAAGLPAVGHERVRGEVERILHGPAG